jgi:hypothetical protein
MSFEREDMRRESIDVVDSSEGTFTPKLEWELSMKSQSASYL